MRSHRCGSGDSGGGVLVPGGIRLDSEELLDDAADRCWFKAASSRGTGPVSEKVPAEVSQQMLPDFEEYVRGSAKRLFGRAWWRCGQWHLAHDLTQETYLRLWRVWPDTHEVITQHDSYSETVLKHVCSDYYRRLRPDIKDGEIPNLPGDSGADSRLNAPHENIRGAVSELPPQQRELIYLHYYEGLSLAEIAERMGIAAKTAHNYHTLAKNRLRELLGSASAEKENV